MLFYPNLAAYVEGERQKLDGLLSANIPESGVIVQVLDAPGGETRNTHPHTYSVTREVGSLLVDHHGIRGSRHHGMSRNSTGREREQYPRGTIITGGRHIFAVSTYDCNVLSDSLGVEVTPELLGANLVIGREDGKPYSLSAVPAGTRFSIMDSGSTDAHRPPTATLINYVQQQGCAVTGNAIAAHYGRRELSAAFIRTSKKHRGIVCNIEYPVEQPIALRAGQKVYLRFPMNVAP